MPRDVFATRLGFVLASAGSAIGLGNIWKFPYMAGANGGAAFLLVYLGFVVSLGLGVMLAEFAVGRAAQANPVGAFRALGGRRWVGVGYLCVATGFLILGFYSVVGGWTLAYAAKAATGALATDDTRALGALFGGFTSTPAEPVIYHGLFLGLVFAVVAGGVTRGIERAAKVLMPVLLVLLVVLVVRAVTLPGAGRGVAFFLQPDFSRLGWDTVNAAMSQAFFSLSLGMGALLTYGSYLGRTESLPKSALMITGLDTAIALLAGFLVLPAVFAFGFDPAAGPGLSFITLPAVFSQMPAGPAFATAFFGLLAIAALTSAVSMLEVPVSYFVDERGWPRARAAGAVGAVCFLIGVPASLSFGPWRDMTLGGRTVFDLMDFAVTNLALPVGGLAIALFVGWVAWPRLLAEVETGNGGRFRPAAAWKWLLRLAAPAAIGWILASGLWPQ